MSGLGRGIWLWFPFLGTWFMILAAWRSGTREHGVQQKATTVLWRISTNSPLPPLLLLHHHHEEFRHLGLLTKLIPISISREGSGAGTPVARRSCRNFHFHPYHHKLETHKRKSASAIRSHSKRKPPPNMISQLYTSELEPATISSSNQNPPILIQGRYQCQRWNLTLLTIPQSQLGSDGAAQVRWSKFSSLISDLFFKG